jgi:hypothetical protein
MADNFNDIIAQQTPPVFGNRGPGVFGRKFVDINADGIQQPNETQPIANLPFILERLGGPNTVNGIADGPNEDRTTTDANGNFRFINLTPGVYRLTELVPPGAFVTTGDKTGVLQVVIDKTDVNVLFGNSTTPGSGIVGCKYLDLDGDGFRDGNEPGIKNVRIFLDGSDGSVPDGNFQSTELNTLTNKDGEWQIPVSAGTYRVREERVNGPNTQSLENLFPQSTPPNNVPLLDVTVKEGQTFYCAQVGNAPLYEIPVEKFRDLDGNGKRNVVNEVSGFSGLEPGIADVPFILDLNKDGKWQKGQEPILITGPDGTNSFTNLKPGNYSVLEIFKEQLVGEVLPDDLTPDLTPGRTNVDPGNLNFPIGSTPNPLQVSAPGTGSQFQGSISESAPLISTDTTGYNRTFAGGSDPNDSGNLYDPVVPAGQRPIFVKDTFTPITNAQPTVSYSPIPSNPGLTGGVGVGNTRPSINVFKFLDLDGDGIYEPIITPSSTPGQPGTLNPKGERPLRAIKVAVDLNGDGDFQDVVDGQPESQDTDVNGIARFANIDTTQPFDYTVVEQLDPNSGYVPSTPPTVKVEKDKLVNQAAGVFQDARVVFGNTPKSKITGCKFEDLNQNGYRDGNEPGIAGVTIAIDENNNGVLDAPDRTTTSDQFGNWSFDNLAPGLFHIREVTPEGAFKTTQPLDINLGANQTFTCALIGNSSRYDLLVPKFRDDNRDGIQNNGEPALPNIPFALDSNLNGRYDVGEPLAYSQQDGQNGALFRSLRPGTYSVLEVFGDPNVRNPFPVPTGPNPVNFTVPGPNAVIQNTTPTTPVVDGTVPLSSATSDLLTDGGLLATAPTSDAASFITGDAASSFVPVTTEESFSSLSIVPQDPLTDDQKLLLAAPAPAQVF